MRIYGQWATFPMGGKNYGADLFDVRGVPGSPNYEAKGIMVAADPTGATSPPVLEIEICRQSGGTFAREQPVCSGHLKLCTDPVAMSRVFLASYSAVVHPVSSAGGSLTIPGPFPADGLHVRLRSDYPLSGSYAIDFRQAVGITAKPPPHDAREEDDAEPECRCRSLLFGHERGCPWAR